MAAFTTIATAAGLAISTGGAASSFVQAGKQRKKQEAAERAAGKAMEDAKSKLQTTFMKVCLFKKKPMI